MVIDVPHESNSAAGALGPEIEQLIQDRVDTLVGERFNQLIAEQLAVAMKKDPAKSKVAIIISKGTLDMAYPPLILASTAAAMGEDVTVFCTFYGLNILKKGEARHLKVAPIANPAMPVPMPTIIGMLPGMTSMATWIVKNQFFAKHQVAPIQDLLQECLDLGVKFIACQMTLDVMRIKTEDLIDGVEVGGAATFINTANEAHITLFI